ncbi:MAG TPA: hypothetical protein VFZ16_20485 [Hyphomicrobiaceae bacterium]|nr:hypothetical protein [Hyphomicrobiaceae bacterium]
MSRKILSLAGYYVFRKEDVGRHGDDASKVACPQITVPNDGTVPVEDMRDVATETALASAVDASPAVLVSLWAQDGRLHPARGRRSS